MVARHIQAGSGLAAGPVGAAYRCSRWSPPFSRSSLCIPGCSRFVPRSRRSAARWPCRPGAAARLRRLRVIWMEGLWHGRLADGCDRHRDPRRTRPISRQGRPLPGIYDVTTDPIDPPRYDARRGCGRATPTQSSIRACSWPSCSSRPIPTSSRSTPISTARPPTTPRWRSSTGADGASSRRAPPIRAARKAASKRWREHRSWASATTSSVRVRPDDGARVDIRSSSRYGSFDFGANAARIRSLIEDIEAEFANQAPDEPPPVARPKGPAKSAPKAPPKAAPKAAPKNQPTANR